MSSSERVVDVKPIDFKIIPSTSYIIILGKRGTGKSTWARHLMNNMQVARGGMVVVMAGSERVKQSWGEHVPPLFVVDVSVDYLVNLIKQRNAIVRKYEGKPFPPAQRMVLVMDDTSSNKAFMKSKPMLYLASNSRHLEMIVILLAQYLVQIVSEIRSQPDFVLTLNTSSLVAMRKLNEEFVASETLRIFRSVMTAVTSTPYSCFIIDNRVNAVKLDDHCYYGKMPWPLEDVRLGSPAAWDFSRKHYLPNQGSVADKLKHLLEDDEDFDVDAHDLTVLENKHVMSDRLGRIVVRVLPPNLQKTKTD